ncbi:FimV/HubP family polar landmark protein [Litchfieldella xinjiangensis]|uniref:FimV/HubP family polar landmark protein n=1 Tax=Litchfieldella xinjiangensis TaxID=1166948 RepID=UPI0005B9E776|nr:FimV/HubP family polar landmark protein [Halomonas xinjiangensis]
MRRKLSLALLLSLASASPLSLALGLGEASVQSNLNTPLRATIPVTDAQDIEAGLLKVSLAAPSAFERAGLSRSRLAADIALDVEHDRQGVSLTLRSERAIHDPYLDLLLSLEWPGGQQLHQVTLLLDPVDYVHMPALVPAVARSAVSGESLAVPTLEMPIVGSARPSARAPGAVETGQAWVGSGDTLWGVAQRLRPGTDISIHQMMLALVEANPQAFPSGNINGMRAGMALVVPSREAIQRRDMGEADRQVAAHNQDWNQRDSGMAVASDVSPAQQGRVLGMDTAASTAEAPGHRSALLSEAQLNAETEQAADPYDRLSWLEAQWQQSQHALETVRSEREALKAALGGLREELDQLHTQLADATRVSADTLPGDTHTRPASAPTDEDDGMLAQINPQGAGTFAQTSSTPWWGLPWQGLRDNPLALGGALLALLLAWVVLRRRRQVQEESPTFSQAYGMGASVVTARQGEEAFSILAADTQPETLTPSSAQSHDTAEEAPSRTFMPEAEVISEADIFVAYGRYDQARDLLEASLTNEPDRQDLRIKLVKVHAQRNDWEAAEREGERLRQSGTLEVIEEVDRILAGRDDTTLSQASHDERAPSEGLTLKESATTEREVYDIQAETQEDRRIAAPVSASQASHFGHVIDYCPPSLDPEPAPRSETPMQPSIEFSTRAPEASISVDPLRVEEAGPEPVAELPRWIAEDPRWDVVEEVAFEPLHLDNKGPAAASPEASLRLVGQARQLLDAGESERAHELLQQVLDHDDVPLRKEARKLIAQYNLD